MDDDAEWELNDDQLRALGILPNSTQPGPPPAVTEQEAFPNVHELFRHYNHLYFESKLGFTSVEWSTGRMTLCAGICSFSPAGGCRIRLSEPLLKYRPVKDLKETLLHEMIHAYMFLEGIRDHDDHGPKFKAKMNAINTSRVPDHQRPSAGYNIDTHHTMINEVNLYRVHWWQCDRCGNTIKRSMNRKPQPADCRGRIGRGDGCRDPYCHYHTHIRNCGGTYIKIKGPDLDAAAAGLPPKGKARKGGAGGEGSSGKRSKTTTTEPEANLSTASQGAKGAEGGGKGRSKSGGGSGDSSAGGSGQGGGGGHHSQGRKMGQGRGGARVGVKGGAPITQWFPSQGGQSQQHKLGEGGAELGAGGANSMGGGQGSTSSQGRQGCMEKVNAEAGPPNVGVSAGRALVPQVPIKGEVLSQGGPGLINHSDHPPPLLATTSHDPDPASCEPLDPAEVRRRCMEAALHRLGSVPGVRPKARTHTTHAPLPLQPHPLPTHAGPAPAPPAPHTGRGTPPPHVQLSALTSQQHHQTQQQLLCGKEEGPPVARVATTVQPSQPQPAQQSQQPRQNHRQQQAVVWVDLTGDDNEGQELEHAASRHQAAGPLAAPPSAHDGMHAGGLQGVQPHSGEQNQLPFAPAHPAGGVTQEGAAVQRQSMAAAVHGSGGPPRFGGGEEGAGAAGGPPIMCPVCCSTWAAGAMSNAAFNAHLDECLARM